MKYFKLEYNSLNIKETGTQFQCVSVEKLGDIQNDSFPMEGLVDFPFDLPIPIMENKAKPTTILNVIPINKDFLILEDSFIDYLKKNDVKGFQTWKLKVKHKNEYYVNYNLFFMNFPIQRDIIRFEDSDFYKGKFSDYLFVGEKINIESYNDYLNILNRFKNSADDFLKFKKIGFDLSKLEIDMFRICNIPFEGYFVSQKLKESIEEQGFTGFIFKEIEKLDGRIKVIY